MKAADPLASPEEHVIASPESCGRERVSFSFNHSRFISAYGYADDEIVVQHWDEILRLIATIKLKGVTASDLFRRLNSYSKQHALYRAGGLKSKSRVRWPHGEYRLGPAPPRIFQWLCALDLSNHPVLDGDRWRRGY